MKQKEFVTPSGLKFTLREQTGDDDERLSAAQSETTLVNTYIANVIVKGPTGQAMDAEAVKKLRLGDKYFLVLASRMFSLGETLYFQYTWPGEKAPLDYEEDLSRYLWDYTKAMPEISDPEYFSQRIKAYPKEEFINGDVRGMKLRMDYLDGHGEDYMMKLPANQRTVNKELVARNLRVFDAGDWKPVVNFTTFSAREMIYIRNLAHDNDPPIDGLTEIENPVSGELLELPILGIKDFFYPVKI